MRIAVIETQHGIRNAEGLIPNRVAVVETWESFPIAIHETEEELAKRQAKWTTKQASELIVEIDVHDPPTETMITLIDADQVERQTGTPIMDVIKFMIQQGPLAADLAVETPEFKAHPDQLHLMDGARSGYEWARSFQEIERDIRARRRVRGVMLDQAGKATKVRLWDAVLGFKGELQVFMVWDGADGPERVERLGLGRGGGAIQQVPPGVLFISWRRLREFVGQGKECLVGGSLAK